MTSPTRTLNCQATTRSLLRKFVALERFPSEGVGTRPENEQQVSAVEGMKWNSTPVHLCAICMAISFIFVIVIAFIFIFIFIAFVLVIIIIIFLIVNLPLYIHHRKKTRFSISTRVRP